MPQGAVFSARVWLCDMLIQAAYPHLIESVWLQDMKMGALTQFGMLGGEAGSQCSGQPNRTRDQHSTDLLFDRFLRCALMASSLQNGFYKFCLGLFCLWVVMAFGLASIAARTFW